MISTVLRLEFDAPPHSAVIKLAKPGESPGEHAFGEQAGRLDFLARHTAFPCPRVYAQDSTGSVIPNPYLLIETLPGVHLGAASLTGAPRADVDRQLAAILLELHSHHRGTFGNIDAPGPARWAEVFVPRLESLRRDPDAQLPRPVRDDVDFALARAQRAFSEQGPPTLVHGDIWSANIMVERRDGVWRVTGLVDPGAQFADVEYELAYLEVFQTVSRRFFEVYTASRPLRPGYAQRRAFYWLHTYLVHVRCFGGSHYLEQAARAAAAIRQTHR